MIEVIGAILVFTVLPLALIAGVAAAIVSARHQSERDDPTIDEGIGSVRRLFIYALALVGVIFAAIGVAMIIGGALDAITGGALLLERRQGLAIALAFTVVGTPAWLLFMLLAQRSVQAHEVERRSQARRLYFAVARSVALSVLAWNAIEAMQMVLQTSDFAGGAWGHVVAWSGVWAIHQRLAAAEPATTGMTRLIDRLALYFGALLGLLLLLSGTIAVIDAPLSEAYDRTFRGSIVTGGWDRGLREGFAVLVVGAGIWGWHWLARLVRRDRLTTLWRVQVFLFGALLGVVLAITPAAVMLYDALEWFLGVPGEDSAVAHFALFPGAISALIGGVATWGYHRATIIEAGDAHERSGPERVYRYLLSAAGLITLAVGVATLIALAAEGLGGPGAAYVVAANWWRNPLLRGITLLAVGVPLWARYWRDTQRALATGLEERTAPSRRVYVFATVGVAIFALLVSLTVVLYLVFIAALNGELSLGLLRDVRWGLGVAVTTGAIAYYHFLVLREDQAAMPAAPPVARRARQVVLVASGDATALIADLEGIDGVRVRLWRRTDAEAAGGADGALSGDRREALRQAVASADADRLLAVVTRGDFELVPYVEDAR
ncbi:MAG: DUF5671 domain-containing protein [Dehalococcoidia bacterium]